MPSLFKFLSVTGALVAIVYGGLYVLATRYEPELRPTVYRLHDLKASGLITPETPESAEAVHTTSDAE